MTVQRYKRRADGWPLCPVCGEDELSCLPIAPMAVALGPWVGIREWCLDHELFCYVCGRVTVPEADAQIVASDWPMPTTLGRRL